MALESGTVVNVGGDLLVNVGGVVDPAIEWAAPGYIPLAGDVVRIVREAGRALVVGPIAKTARPLLGTVTTTASSGTVGILGDDGATYQARYTGAAPGTGDRVRLDWSSTTPWVWPGSAALLPSDPGFFVPPPPTPPPPPVVRSGTLAVAPFASGSGRPFGWEPGDVKQGAYGGGQEYRGAWFHGGAVGQLAGAQITGLRIFLGPRLRLGSYNSPATLHFYRHVTDGPSATITRVEGPYDVSIPAGFGGGWVDLAPVAGWVAGLIADPGGIAIYGAPYAGVAGGGESGLLHIDWRR